MTPLPPLPPLRYVVLWHTGIPTPHFDLMVETRAGSELAAWRSPVWPIETSTPLTRLKDHRRIYLEFEGELSERRGRVERVGEGTCQLRIGENAVWQLKMLNQPMSLQLRQISDGHWQATKIPL